MSYSYGSMNLNSSFKVFNVGVSTVRLVQFIIQTNKYKTYIYIYKHINNIVYILISPTCFDASAW